MTAWFNGASSSTLPLDERAAAFGDACFTTMRLINGEIEFLAEHLARMREASARLKINNVSWARIEKNLSEVSTRCEDGVLRLTVSRGQSVGGYACSTATTSNFWLQWRALPKHLIHWRTEGVSIRLCQQTLSQNSTLAGIKHNNRLEQVLARLEWSDASIAEGLVSDVDGYVIEATAANLFFVTHDNTLCTPSLHLSGVAGVIRQIILHHAHSANIAVNIADFTWPQIAPAREIFICNSVMGIVPVVRCEESEWPIGDLTRHLQLALFASGSESGKGS